MEFRSHNRASQKKGRIAEALVQAKLESLGYKLIEHPEPARIKTAKGYIYAKKVSGDFRAIDPAVGRSVLVEVKYRDRPLRKSDFQPHQIKSMQEHFEAHGITLVAHVSRKGVMIYGWFEFFLKEGWE